MTLAQYSYQDSPYVKRAKEDLIYPDIQRFYASLLIIFLFVAFGLILTVRAIVRKWITTPIKVLRGKISKNDLGSGARKHVHDV